MAHRFVVDSSPPGSPAPSTPAKTPQVRGISLGDVNHPSTTPAGPPPSSAASFTPAGAPSDSYLGSSIMRGVTSSRQQQPFGGSSGFSKDSTGRNLFGSNQKSSSSAPLGRSIRGSQRQPSALSRQYSLGDVHPEEEDEDASGEDDEDYANTFAFSRGQSGPGADSTHDQMSKLIERDMGYGSEDDEDEDEDDQGEFARALRQDSEEEEEEEEEDGEADEEQSQEDEGDLFLNLRHDDREYGRAPIGEDDEDLMMLNTPAATKRARKEAQSLMRRSSAQYGGSGNKRAFEYARIAKDQYTRQEVAELREPSDLILKTEDLVCRLYHDGVGTEDDMEKMDNSLASITYNLVKLWGAHVKTLDKPTEEEIISVGPGPDADPFEKAQYVGQLLLRLHHTRYQDEEGVQPLSAVLIDWQRDCGYNPAVDEAQNILHYKPSPASHNLFWSTVLNCLVRGEVTMTARLLQNAGWEHVRNIRNEKTYTGQALHNVQRFTDLAIDTLESCPSQEGDWDVFGSSWSFFRPKARSNLDRMTLFAEGRDQTFNDLDGIDQESMSQMARKASSKLPWDVYENLQNVYGILLGEQDAIVGVAQDWCEATIGIFCWWDQGFGLRNNMRLAHSQSLQLSSRVANNEEEYLERLADAFHAVLSSDLQPNTMNPVEVAVASTLEGNVNAVIGILRTWSLPVACSVAEVASLGGWLPPTEAAKPLPFDDALDMEDLALLNISQPAADEVLGIKDDTLEKYARDLAGIEYLSPQKEGWEMAIQVLGRMDLPEKSEEIVGELLTDLLKRLNENSAPTVDKMWGALNDLGMISYAEETAETFADTLSSESHRYGEALWYYALSHRTDKVRDVLNLLMSYSLVQSTAYPAEKDLDDELKNLLQKRTETLERRAKQDLEAAQLLGRMLSGYATLRKFYELRDQAKEGLAPSKAKTLKKQAASALVAVISSSDDNIRGGLYDETRDSVVSEDFLLALLGEATVFVNQSPPCITLNQIDPLIKAIEDIQSVGSRVYGACEEFFDLVLESTQGLKGSTPADLMKKSTNALSGSSYVMTGSSMLVNQMHKSVSGSGKVARGWDWRKHFNAQTKADDVLRKLRLGLARDLATLWLEEADGIAGSW